MKRAKSNERKTEQWHPTAIGGYRLCSDHFISGESAIEFITYNYINLTLICSKCK